jgi:hypothetical protein
MALSNELCADDVSTFPRYQIWEPWIRALISLAVR